MSEEEMETSGEESEVSEDEMEMGDEEMEMGDEEMETSDEESGLSSEELESSDEEMAFADNCPYCRLNKSAAESRLHDVPPEVKWMSGSNLPTYTIKVGSRKGCQFCGLLMDAVKVWLADRGLKPWKFALRYILRLVDGHWTLKLQLPNNDVSVFRGTGCHSLWNLCGPPQISGDTSSPEAAETVRRWIQDCMETHDLCNHKNPMQGAPKRILELDGEQVKLREHLRIEEDYACLSHCWGPLGPAMQLTAHTIDVLKAGFLVDELPKTFRDAAHFCWKLDIRYIWIDALCILQDNDKDWDEATVYMADTYEGAVVTIAATWSSSSNDGCFAPATKRVVGTALAEPGLYIADSLLGFPREAGEVDKPHWPLLNRAWVFQERKLSTRVLHFCKEQFFWECNSRFTSEDSVQRFPYGGHLSESLSPGDFKNSRPKDPAKEWKTAIEYYSALNLTKEKDRLPAIAGFVKRMQGRRPGDVYIAGMWLSSLLSDLSWYGDSIDPGLRPIRRGTVLPSWSWISVSSKIIYTEAQPHPSLILVDAVYDLTGPAHIGQVLGASITLEASFFPVKAFPDYEESFKIIGHGDLFRGQDGPLLTNFYNCWDFDFTSARFAMVEDDGHELKSNAESLTSRMCMDGKFFLLLLTEERYHSSSNTEYIGMVIHELESKQYQRVGAVILDLVDRTGLERFSTQEIQLAADGIRSLPIGQFTII